MNKLFPQFLQLRSKNWFLDEKEWIERNLHCFTPVLCVDPKLIRIFCIAHPEQPITARVYSWTKVVLEGKYPTQLIEAVIYKYSPLAYICLRLQACALEFTVLPWLAPNFQVAKCSVDVQFLATFLHWPHEVWMLLEGTSTSLFFSSPTFSAYSISLLIPN